MGPHHNMASRDTQIMAPPDASMAVPPPADDMMREPNGAGGDVLPPLNRAVLDYAAHNDRFSLDKKIYGQYFQLYFQRLMLLLPRLKDTAAATWPGAVNVKVLDLKVGTITRLDPAVDTRPGFPPPPPFLPASTLELREATAPVTRVHHLRSDAFTFIVRDDEDYSSRMAFGASSPHYPREGEECVIMGTLYKEMKLKPCILDEYTKDAGLGTEVSSGKFISDDDTVVLEDEGARVKLGGDSRE